MSERVWDIHAPNVEGRNCRYCGELFYPEHHSHNYCSKHRASIYVQRAKYGIGDTKTIACKACGTEFTIETKQGAIPKMCERCRPVKNVGADEIGSRAWVLATRKLNNTPGLFNPKMNIARMPSTWDDEYAQIEWMFREDQETVLRDLDIHEVVYANSITEHHQHPFMTQRLLLAVENVSDTKRDKEMGWAQKRLREMRIPRENGDKAETVEEIWSAPPRTEREQWVVNLMARFQRIE